MNGREIFSRIIFFWIGISDSACLYSNRCLLNIWYFWRGNIFLIIISFGSASTFVSIATAMFFWYLIFLEGKNISDNHICLEHVYFATFIFVMSICVHSDTFLISQKEEELPPTHLKSHQSIIPKKTGWKSLNTTLHFPLFNRPFQKPTRLKITPDHCTVYSLTIYFLKIGPKKTFIKVDIRHNRRGVLFQAGVLFSWEILEKMFCSNAYHSFSWLYFTRQNTCHLAQSTWHLEIQVQGTGTWHIMKNLNLATWKPCKWGIPD